MSIEKIKQRLNALSSKNWRTKVNEYNDWSIIGEIESISNIRYHETYVAQWMRHSDAWFIANAPNDIEYLIKEVERLQAENAELKNSLTKSDCLTFCKKIFRRNIK